MKNELLIIFTLVFNFSQIVSLTSPQLDSHIQNFVKFKDQQELIQILNLIQDQSSKLQANKDNHLLMCEKTLYSCKVKFENKLCQNNNEQEAQELVREANTQGETMKASQELINKLIPLIGQTEEDCKNLKNIFEQNQLKFKDNLQSVQNIAEKVKTKFIQVKENQNFKEEEERQRSSEELATKKKELDEVMRELEMQELNNNFTQTELSNALREEEEKKNLLTGVQQMVIMNNKTKQERNTVQNNTNGTLIKDNIITGNTTEQNKNETLINENTMRGNTTVGNKTTMNDTIIGRNETISNSDNKINITVQNQTNGSLSIENKMIAENSTNNYTNNTTINSTSRPLNTFFISKIKENLRKYHETLNEKEKLHQNFEDKHQPGMLNTIFLNFAQITQGVSMVQLHENSKEQSTTLSFSQIDMNLEKLDSLKEKEVYLEHTLENLETIVYNLKQGLKELSDSYIDSSRDCEERMMKLKEKKSDLIQTYMDSKISVEAFNKRIELLESLMVSCKISEKNTSLCNRLSDYCNKYQIEFSEEMKELEDLTIYFKQYLDQK